MAFAPLRSDLSRFGLRATATRLVLDPLARLVRLRVYDCIELRPEDVDQYALEPIPDYTRRFLAPDEVRCFAKDPRRKPQSRLRAFRLPPRLPPLRDGDQRRPQAQDRGLAPPGFASTRVQARAKSTPQAAQAATVTRCRPRVRTWAYCVGCAIPPIASTRPIACAPWLNWRAREAPTTTTGFSTSRTARCTPSSCDRSSRSRRSTVDCSALGADPRGCCPGRRSTSCGSVVGVEPWPDRSSRTEPNRTEPNGARKILRTTRIGNGESRWLRL